MYPHLSIPESFMNKKRVVVTGMGLVSCFGSDIDEFYNRLLAGESGIVPIEEFPCQDFPTRFAGVVRNFDVGVFLEKKTSAPRRPFHSLHCCGRKKSVGAREVDGRSA